MSGVGDLLALGALVAAVLVLGAVLGVFLAGRERRPRPRCTCTAAECRDSWHAAQGPCCGRCTGHRDVTA